MRVRALRGLRGCHDLSGTLKLEERVKVVEFLRLRWVAVEDSTLEGVKDVSRVYYKEA